MVIAFSQLRRVLDDRRMSVSELRRQMLGQGVSVNLKSLYRLNDNQRPIGRLDLRVAGVICQVCQVPLSELIAFEIPASKLQRLPAAKQKLLDALMTKNNSGVLTSAERNNLQTLVQEAQELTLRNARMLARQHHSLASSGGGR